MAEASKRLGLAAPMNAGEIQPGTGIRPEARQVGIGLTRSSFDFSFCRLYDSRVTLVSPGPWSSTL
jgi:hypothetical protein